MIDAPRKLDAHAFERSQRTQRFFFAAVSLFVINHPVFRPEVELSLYPKGTSQNDVLLGRNKNFRRHAEHPVAYHRPPNSRPLSSRGGGVVLSTLRWRFRVQRFALAGSTGERSLPGESSRSVFPLYRSARVAPRLPVSTAQVRGPLVWRGLNCKLPELDALRLSAASRLEGLTSLLNWLAEVGLSG